MRSFLFILAIAFAPSPQTFDWRTLALDAYPPAARDAIGAAVADVLRQPSDAEAAGRLGLVLHAWEQFDLAEHAYASARRLAPRDVAWWALSGILATRSGQHDRAVEYYGEAVGLDATLPLLSLRLADALLETNRLADARTRYDALTRQAATEPAAWYGLGRVARAEGHDDAARDNFTRAVSLAPTFGAAHFALAQLQRKAGDLDAARASLARQQQCLACWPFPPDPWAQRLAAVRSDAATLLQRGISQARQDDDAAAIATHEAALAKDPALGQARTNLITLYARTGNLPKAEAHYKAVLATGDSIAESHHTFGLALAAAGDTARAEPILRQAIEGNPQDAEALNALALLLEGARRSEEAEPLYLRAVAARPTERQIRFNYARVLVNRRAYDDAIAQLSRLTAQDDAESARYVFALAAAHARKGDIAAAKRIGQEALTRARRHGLTDLAASIERDLARLPQE